MRRGLSLMELLSVVAIISIIAAILVPALMLAKKRAKEPVEVSNMRQLYLGYLAYLEENNDTPPDMLVGTVSYVKSQAIFASPGDNYRKGFPDGTWPSKALIPCGPDRSRFKVSYPFLKNFAPYDTDPQAWRQVAEDYAVGLIASPWMGSPMPQRNLLLWCGDPVLASLGPPMLGPIHRINMDGSFFRLPKNRNVGAIGNPKDLFFNR